MASQYLLFAMFVGVILAVVFLGGALGGFFVKSALRSIPIWAWAVAMVVLIWWVRK